MADLIIKPTSGNLLIKDDQDATRMTVATSTGNISLGTVTAGTIGTGVTKKIHAFSAYNSADDCAIATGTWVEASATGTWVEQFDSLGHYASGRFTPTVQGIYLIGYSAGFKNVDANEYGISAIRKNGSYAAGDLHGWSEQRNPGTGSNYDIGLSGSSIIQLDTNDYVSLWCHHNEGGTQNLIENKTRFWGTYIGTV